MLCVKNNKVLNIIFYITLIAVLQAARVDIPHNLIRLSLSLENFKPLDQCAGSASFYG